MLIKTKILIALCLSVTSIVFVFHKIQLNPEFRIPTWHRDTHSFQQSTGGDLEFDAKQEDGHYATIVLISRRSDYSNDSNLLSSLLVDLVLSDCRTQSPIIPSYEAANTTITTSNSNTGYLLYVVGDRNEMPPKTSDVETAVLNKVSASDCPGIVVKVVAVTSPLTEALNRAVLDAYLDHESDYFRLIFLSSVTSSELLKTSYFRKALNRRISPSDHGIIIEKAASKSVESSAQPVAIVSAFFGTSHFEIFGWFLPPSESNVMKSIKLLSDIYGAHNMSLIWHSSLLSSNASEISSTTRSGHDDDDIKEINNDQPHHALMSEMTETLTRYLSARAANPCWRSCETTLTAAANVVSMSLYGSSRRYTVGAIRNAHLLPVNFPGWTLRIYHELPKSDGSTQHGTVPSFVLRRLARLGVDLRAVDIDTAGGALTARLAPMMWRFLIAVDPSVKTFIVRDSDSRLTPRDASVVEDWLRRAPDTAFHCIRDHPSHSGWAVSGGLWGGKPIRLNTVLQAGKPPLKDFVAVMQRYSSGYFDDMNFLGRDVWPIVKSAAFCHDSFSCDRHDASHPFPVARIGGEHVGEVYNEFSIGRASDINKLLKARVNSVCVPKEQ